MDTQFKKTLEEAYGKKHLITVSYMEGDKINHIISQNDFPEASVMPSLDHCGAYALKKAKKKLTNSPLKIAVISHSESLIDTYSISTAIRNQVLMLKRYGHTVHYFGRPFNSYDFCEVKKVMPQFKREKMVVNEEGKQKMIKVFREHLPNYDIAITHDFFIDDTITHREAIKECGVDIPWLHFIRSGIGHPVDFAMPNARYVGLNHADLPKYARMIGVPVEQMATVYNIKDPLIFHEMELRTQEIVENLKLWEKDYIQVYPFCITRADAKGVNHLIKLFSRLPNSQLIFCEANKKEGIREQKMELAESLGTNLYFTGAVPQKVVAELMQLSNIFVFPTIAETCGQVMLEAAMGKNLVVINSQVKTLSDFMPEDAMKHDFNSPDYDGLAKSLMENISHEDKIFRYVWRNHNIQAVYKQLNNLLYLE